MAKEFGGVAARPRSHPAGQAPSGLVAPRIDRSPDEVEIIREMYPKRSSFSDWYAWMDARSKWAMDLFHATERRDRRARFPRTFA